MPATAATQFIRGKPAPYTGFDRRLYVARYADGQKNKLGVGSLTITTPAGNIIRDVLMGEFAARSFFWNLDCEAA